MPALDSDATTPGLRHVTLTRAVYDELKRRIVDRELQPGQRLVERTLAEELDVSRVPVREALRDLLNEGFLESRTRQGLYVRNVSQADLDEMIELRTVLDGFVFSRAAARLDDDGVAAIESLLDGTRAAIAAGDHAKAVELNSRFHDLLVDLAGSRLLAELMDGLGSRLRWMLYQHEDPEVIFAEHVEILAALRSPEPEKIRQLAASHMETSRRLARELNPYLVAEVS